MTGILLIDKPQGFTSFDVVAKVRGIAATRKAGHGGTLDPMATGVLPLFLGGATKACDILPNQTKAYRARFQLGVVTDTQDITGTVLSRREVAAGRADVERALEGFRGKILQVPPMYSAVWVNGQRLYDLAREGRVVEREARPVEIHALELVEADEERGLYTVEVSCSKGTYIRTICHDIGELLGCGAALTELRRTVSSGWRVEDAITIPRAQELADRGELEAALLPVESAFLDYKELPLQEKDAVHFKNGVRMTASRFGVGPQDGILRIKTREGLFVGLGAVDAPSGELRLLKLFADR
ncbi:MAG: tRNA pseudouridine(55) synthase TruB [Oscillospiraceae bacterium]|nr:tRNA pseudouridine(55) synthase TruB [Oscillospiraceae bacterium]